MASLLTLATAVTSLGCAPDRGPGSLVVTYVLGNNKTCDELGVRDLRAELTQGPATDSMVLYSEDMACVTDGELVLDGLDPGIYSLVVKGYDANGVAILDNLGQPDTERAIEIFEAAQDSIEAELTDRPAQLEVAWRLGVNGFSNCESEGIDRLRIMAFQVGGGTVLLDTELDCELPGDTSDGYRLIPDPNRELNGVLFGEAGVQAIDAAGAPIGDPASFMFDPVGPGYSVKLNIECTSSGCYEQP